MRWSLFKNPPLLLPTLEEVSADLEPKDEPSDLFIALGCYSFLKLFVYLLSMLIFWFSERLMIESCKIEWVLFNEDEYCLPD